MIEDYQQAHRSLQEIKSKIRALGNVNVGAIEEYKEVSERYEFMSAQLEDIEKSREELNRLITELTSKMYFNITFKHVVRIFKNKLCLAAAEKLNKSFAEIAVDTYKLSLELLRHFARQLCNESVQLLP